MRGWMMKTSHDVCRGSYFVTYFVGLPLPGHVYLPLRFPPSSEDEPAHIPLEGEGRLWLGSELVGLLVALVIGPTSLKRGEGLPVA